MASLMYLAHLQMIPWILPPAVFVLWYGAEWMVAKLLHWPHSARDVCAMIIRDMLLPLLWLWCWAGRSFVWHGNAMNSPASVNVKEHKEMEH
jgi:ceramide glucosyltransferase